MRFSSVALIALSLCGPAWLNPAAAQGYPHYGNPYEQPYGNAPYGAPGYPQAYEGGGRGRCAPLVSTQETAMRFSPDQIRAIAIDRWRNETANRFGPQFSDFGRARQANVSCGPMPGGFRCLATGYPCL